VSFWLKYMQKEGAAYFVCKCCCYHALLQ
jgi:hypothetical protein